MKVMLLIFAYLALFDSFICLNIENCKITQEGTEYRGKQSRTMSGRLCDDWTHVKNSQLLHDLSFPDGSKVLAKNDCRNPTKNVTGPWCFTQGVSEYCDIPLCNIEECRFTGPGLEYNGTINQSAWFQKCLPWPMEDFKLCRSATDNPATCNMCRNPDLSREGPWCNVFGPGGKKQKQLCDVPLCLQSDPVIVIKDETGTFNQFFSFDAEYFSAEFQLWDASDWVEGRVAILLAVTDQSLEIAKLKEWASGVALVFGNRGAFLTTPEGEDKITKLDLLRGTKSTNVTIKWSRNDDNGLAVFVHFNGEEAPSLVAEFDTEGGLLENHDFEYFSIVGTPLFITLPPLIAECSIVTTGGSSAVAWWLLERIPGHTEFSFSLRLTSDATLILSASPWAKTFITLTFSKNGRLRIDVIKDQSNKKISERDISKWSFWDWHGIKIKFWIGHLVLFALESSSMREVVNVTELPEVTGVMWIAPSSRSVAQWMLHCKDLASEFTSKDEPPECVSSESDLFYNGTHSIANGRHCVPWIDKRIPVQYRKEGVFNEFGSKALSMNYCRNLDFNQTGPFCFVHSTKFEVTKELCQLPRCRQTECKISGVGTEYTGDLAFTRSNRTCSKGKKGDTRFCRNENWNIGGPWCTTTDSTLPKDFCYVKECQAPSDDIVLVTESKERRLFYILPLWKKFGLNFWVKTWDPRRESSFAITLWPQESNSYYEILINEGKVQLSYATDKEKKLLIEITSVHLIPSGFWRGFWLRTGPGVVQLGRERVQHAFIDWEASASEESIQFEPVFIDFSSSEGKWVGVSFRKNDCLVEKVNSRYDHRVWPVNFWLGGNPKLLNISIYATSAFAVNLISDPRQQDYFSLSVEDGRIFTLLRTNPEGRYIIHSSILENNVMSSAKWTSVLLKFDEAFLTLELAGIPVFDYYNFSEPLVFYWFSVVAVSGELSWAPNCSPLDFGSEPRDGGWGEWSSWECSATCGGGEGKIQRSCDNPAPNILGKECSGSSTYQGACNDFQCGDVPPEMRKKVRQRLSETGVSLVTNRGESVRLNCNDDLAVLIQNNLPNITFEWTHNGFSWIPNRKGSSDGSDLELLNVGLENSGTYICHGVWEDDTLVLAVASLIVMDKSKATVIARETTSFQLRCLGSTLSHVYADLSQRWEVNGSTWKNYGATFLDATELDTVTDVTNSLQGEWICVISQEDLGLHWKTNWIRLQVKEPPSFWSHLIEDKATAPIFGFVGERYIRIYFVFLVTVLLVAIVSMSVICCFV